MRSSKQVDRYRYNNNQGVKFYASNNIIQQNNACIFDNHFTIKRIMY